MSGVHIISPGFPLTLKVWELIWSGNFVDGKEKSCVLSEFLFIFV